MSKAAKALLLLVATGAFLQTACQNKVVVVDSRNGRPIQGATVYKESGNLSSSRHITDHTGTTRPPQLPGVNKWTAVVSKPGYQTARF